MKGKTAKGQLLLAKERALRVQAKTFVCTASQVANPRSLSSRVHEGPWKSRQGEEEKEGG